MRRERNPGNTYPSEPDERKRCRCRIRLGNAVYRCARRHVDGIHDANEHADDGFAVRW